MISIPAKYCPPFKEGMELTASYERGHLTYSIGEIPVEKPESFRQPAPVRQPVVEGEVATIPLSQPEPDKPKESAYVEAVGTLVDNFMDWVLGKKKKKKEEIEETI